ncbi:MAG: hypothetical protein LBC74_03895 [Planctomycetaceae bacterium]|jgi:predicted esterase|nr:hypothetical protein [Planctomycetaceae bacterium]
MNYRLHIPENIDPNKKYPLLLWLHGVGECGKDNISQLAHMEPLIPFITGEKQRHFFILATQCPADNKMWDISKSKDDEKGDANMTIAMDILDDVIKNYPVDNEAISVFGLSSGGYGVMSIAMKYKGRFATLIPVACNPHKDVYKYTAEHNTAVWILNNTGDKSVIVKRIEEEVKLIHENNGNAYMTNFEDKGHQAWRNAFLHTPLIDWILWYQRNPSPYKPPYGIAIPHRPENEFFKLFSLPLYASVALVFLPLLVITTEKTTGFLRKNKIKKTPAVTKPQEIKYETTEDGFRTWTDASGNEKVELRLIGFAGTHANFFRRDGKLFKAEMDYFSEEDQIILKNILNNAY